MKTILFIYIFLITIFSYSQEKRLALVIGNSDYEKGELKNPVNDAKLIAKTLDSLGFDVIEKYNLVTQLEFKNAIKEFGTRRENYEVGFVYYAGHGIQVNDENFMLPTKETFTSEIDVQEDGVSVKSIVRYLEGKSSQVNILILDACRDNPFESTWKKTRSVKGDGLAKLSPPSGSLIAFSTEPGNTASDGDKENSIYCISLARNMKLENTSLDQVFRNVRREVLYSSNNSQRPIEASQLTGSTFYLVKSNFSKEFEKIESLISNNKNNEAKILINNIILKESNNKRAHKLLGDNYFALKNFELAIDYYDTAIKIDTNYIPAITQKTKVYEEIGDNYGSLGDYQKQNEYYKKSLDEINKLIILDENNKDLYNRRGIIQHYYFNDTINGLIDYNKSIQIDSLFIKPYLNRANLYSEIGEKEKALNDFNKVISLIPNSNDLSKLNIATLYESIAGFNFENNNLNSALTYYTKAIESDPQYDKPYLRRAEVYKAQNDTIKSEMDLNSYLNLQPLSIAGFANKRDAYIEFNKIENAIFCSTNIISFLPKSAINYNNRGRLYEGIKQYDKALADYNKAIELEPEISDWLFSRAYLYYSLNKFENSLNDYLRVLEITPNSKDVNNNIALIYNNYYKNNVKVNEYLTKEIELFPKDANAYVNRGEFYSTINDTLNALKDFNMAIELEPENSNCYYGRAEFYKKQKIFDKSFADYQKAIEINPLDFDVYINRGDLYLELNDYANSLLDYKKAIELSPNVDAGYMKRGELYKLLKDKENSINDYNIAIELAPDNSNYYYGRGKLYEEELNQYNNALLDYDKAIELQPKNTIFLFGRAFLFDKIEQYDKALSDYLKVIEMDPKNSEAYNNVAILFKDYIQNYDKALEFYNKSIELLPDEALGYINRGYLYKNYIKNNEKAILDYNKAIELAPNKANYYIVRGNFYEELKQNDKALLDYNKAIEIEPLNSENFITRAMYYRKQTKQFDLALQDYNKVIELEPKVDSNYSNRAILEFFDLNLKDKATEDFKKAIELAPENSTYYYYRIKTYLFIDDYKNAIIDINKTVAIDKNDPESYFDLAIIYKKQKKYLQALIQISKAIDLFLGSRYTITDIMIIDNLGIEDLYLFRAELYKILLDNESECADYKYAVDAIKDNSTRKKEIELLIKENCK